VFFFFFDDQMALLANTKTAKEAFDSCKN